MSLLVCGDCGAESRSARGFWFEVVGFEQQRAEGGTNHVAARRRTGRCICNGCLTRLKAGISPEQLTTGGGCG